MPCDAPRFGSQRECLAGEGGVRERHDPRMAAALGTGPSPTGTSAGLQNGTAQGWTALAVSLVRGAGDETEIFVLQPEMQKTPVPICTPAP